MGSLFLMDFAPGGTHIPHSHGREEEIHLGLRGSGEMVAGVDASGTYPRATSCEGLGSATTEAPRNGTRMISSSRSGRFCRDQAIQLVRLA